MKTVAVIHNTMNKLKLIWYNTVTKSRVVLLATAFLHHYTPRPNQVLLLAVWTGPVEKAHLSVSLAKISPYLLTTLTISNTEKTAMLNKKSSLSSR
jgi:hypothetical protein